MSNDYVSAEGKTFSDADINRWADEAENDFPDSEVISFTGRPWEAQTGRLEAHTVRLAPGLWSALQATARAQQIGTSELVREYLTRQLLQEH